MSKKLKVLRIDASARGAGSVTRRLADSLVARLQPVELTQRDLADGLPLLDAAWIEANFTDEAGRSPAQRELLALSDELIAELEQADVLLLAVPIYNFGIPAALKAWVDLVARARRTFRYTEQGPVGLLADRPVYLVMASGGTPIGSDIDFASGYLRHVLGFIGLHDVRIIGADAQNARGPAALEQALAEIERQPQLAQVA